MIWPNEYNENLGCWINDFDNMLYDYIYYLYFLEKYITCVVQLYPPIYGYPKLIQSVVHTTNVFRFPSGVA